MSRNMQLVKVYNSLNPNLPDDFSKECINIFNKANQTLFFNLKGTQHKVRRKTKTTHKNEREAELIADQNSPGNENNLKEQSGNEQIECDGVEANITNLQVSLSNKKILNQDDECTVNIADALKSKEAKPKSNKKDLHNLSPNIKQKSIKKTPMNILKINPKLIIAKKDSFSIKRKSVINKALQDTKFKQLETTHLKMNQAKQFETKNTTINIQTQLSIVNPVQRFETKRQDKQEEVKNKVHHKGKTDLQMHHNESHLHANELNNKFNSNEIHTERKQSIEHSEANSKKYPSEKEVRLDLENDIESQSSQKDINLLSEDSDKKIISTPHAIRTKTFLNNIGKCDIDESDLNENAKNKTSKEIVTKLEILSEANEKSEEKESPIEKVSKMSSKVIDILDNCDHIDFGENDLIFSIVEADQTVSENKNFHKCLTGNFSNKNNGQLENATDLRQSTNNLCVLSDLQNTNSPRPK